MSRMGVFVGTAGGTSMRIANALTEAFEIEEVVNMEDDFDDVEDMLQYDVLFIGSSTWGQGDPHYSWLDPLLEIEAGEYDFGGKIVAFFGAGDCQKHGENFLSALGRLYEAFTKNGAKAIGFLPKSLYTYEHSKAEYGDQLCGCGIDEHNESNKSAERISQWIEVLQQELAS